MVIGICDDETIFIDFIEANINEYCIKKGLPYLIEKFDSGEKLLNEKRNINDFDVVFLDVNMKDLDGIDTAKKIRERSSKVFIVFVTAFIDYSVEGYKVNAIRYILKEEPERLRASINECMDAITGEIKMKSNPQTLKYKFLGGYKSINVNQIMYIESNLHKLTFFLNERDSGELYIYDKLDNIAADIEGEEFCRIHKSTLINMNYIKSYTAEEIIMVDGKIIHVPRVKNKIIRKQYTMFKGKI